MNIDISRLRDPDQTFKVTLTEEGKCSPRNT